MTQNIFSLHAPLKHKANELDLSALESGWWVANETWTYASADAPTFTFTIAGDKTSKYSPGMRIKLTQTTVKYFIVTAISYSDPNTTVTVYGGTDYTLVNAAITNPFYSTQKAPQGFPLSPIKWQVEVVESSDVGQINPVQNTWYNIAAFSITIPIGLWDVYYQIASLGDVPTGYCAIQTTLSTTSDGESDTHFSGYFLGAAETFVTNISRRKTLSLSAKAPYYLNLRTIDPGVTEVGLIGMYAPTIIRAVCAYL